MRSIAIQRAGELPPQEKEALERLLGRSLNQDEEVSIRSYPRDLLPEGAADQRTADELAELLAQRLDQVKDLSESELERAVDEAIQFVRRSDSGQR
ncbi:MAG: hypothetical protein FJW34_11420 [Acidobacteria bacterium]|nr:hypothetical protein [Acidobacteriota bacterium]